MLGPYDASMGRPLSSTKRLSPSVIRSNSASRLQAIGSSVITGMVIPAELALNTSHPDTTLQPLQPGLREEASMVHANFQPSLREEANMVHGNFQPSLPEEASMVHANFQPSLREEVSMLHSDEPQAKQEERHHPEFGDLTYEELVSNVGPEKARELWQAMQLSEASPRYADPGLANSPVIEIGDYVEVFSNKMQKWCAGQVIDLGMDNGKKVVKVKYGNANKVIQWGHENLRCPRLDDSNGVPQGFVGEHIQIFSNSERKWCNGVIAEASVDNAGVPTVKVNYDTATGKSTKLLSLNHPNLRRASDDHPRSYENFPSDM
jgi:hypothetical protein